MKLSIFAVLLIAYVAPVSTPSIEWSWGPVLPIDKTSRATAVAGDRIVTVGGTRWQTVEGDRKVKQWLSCAYVLDTRTMAWQALPDYPHEAGYAFAAGVGPKVYIVGGRGTSRGNAGTWTMDLSAAAREWLPGPALPGPRWGMVGGASGGTIYLAGGQEGDPSSAGTAKAARDVLAFSTDDPARGWVRVANFPSTDAEWQMAAVCGGKLYLFGGLSETKEADKGWLPHAEAFSLDLAARSWKQLSPMPEAMGSGACVALDSRHILIAGGYALAVPKGLAPDGKARTYFSTACYVYDTVLDSYRATTPLKLAVGDQGLVCIRDRVFCIGGEDTPLKSRADLVQIGTLRNR